MDKLTLYHESIYFKSLLQNSSFAKTAQTDDGWTLLELGSEKAHVD